MRQGRNVIRSQYVELYVPATSTTLTQFNFLDQPQLRNAVLDGIQVYNVSDIPLAQSGKALVTATIMSRSFLTLYTNDVQNVGDNKDNPVGELIYRYPLVSLHKTSTGTNAFEKELYPFAGQRLDWVKCYVNLGTAIGTGDISYVFQVYYHYPESAYRPKR